MFIELIVFYHNIVKPEFVYTEYFNSRYAYVVRRSVSGIYLSLLELCFDYRSDLYGNHIKTNIRALENRPAELIAFVRTNRVNYKLLILYIFKTLKGKHQENLSFKKLFSDFHRAAIEWTLPIENDRTIFWGQLLHRLLELQSIDDEYLAIAYMKQGDTKTAVSSFTTDIYGNPALRFNANTCRRYLRYVYPYTSAEERTDFEHRYQKHFIVEFDSFAEQMLYEILLNE